MSVKSYESILQDALDRVSDNLDKREGAIIYDALAAAAFALHEQYVELERKLLETFAGTCSRENLILRAEELGIDAPYAASPSVVEAVVTPEEIEVAVGTRFNCDKLNFFVTEKKAAGVYLLECESAGSVGNLSAGVLTPIDYVDGLTGAIIAGIAVYGEEAQDTEAYRASYFASIKNEAKDGNVRQYEVWTESYPGIGGYKIISLWAGRDTVKVSILDAENNPASEELIAAYQAYLDPGGTGLGNGMAPIGAIVTVSTATKKAIALSGEITLTAGYTEPDGLDTLIDAYLRGLAYKKSSVSYMALGAVVLSCGAVDSLSNFLLNGGTADVALSEEEIAVYKAGEWMIV